MKNSVMIHLTLLLTCASFLVTLTRASGPEPTVIFLGGNGRPVMSQASDSGVYAPSNGYAALGSSASSILSTLKARDSSRSESSGGSLYSLIRERLGEKLQERSSKRGPRIIVIPQVGKTPSQPPPAPQQQSQGYQTSSYQSSYPSYASPYPAASSSYPAYSYPSSYQGSYGYHHPYVMSGTSYSSPYTSGYQYSAGPSSSSPMHASMAAAASTPFASYAYAPSNFLSNLLSSGSSAASSLFSKATYASLYPYLTQLLGQSIYFSY